MASYFPLGRTVTASLVVMADGLVKDGICEMI